MKQVWKHIPATLHPWLQLWIKWYWKKRLSSSTMQSNRSSCEEPTGKWEIFPHYGIPCSWSSLQRIGHSFPWDSLGQGSPTFLKLRATFKVPVNAKGYQFQTHLQN